MPTPLTRNLCLIDVKFIQYIGSYSCIGSCKAEKFSCSCYFCNLILSFNGFNLFLHIKAEDGYVIFTFDK